MSINYSNQPPCNTEISPLLTTAVSHPYEEQPAANRVNMVIVAGNWSLVWYLTAKTF